MGSLSEAPPTALELTTVADDEAVAFAGAKVRRYEGLEPDTEHSYDGLTFRTLPRPGELLCRVATANDVHFGEVECGVLEGMDVGPILRAEPGDPPYPDVMNRAAVAEIEAIDPAAVVVKGDLTAEGTTEEYRAFLDCYGRLGERLHHVRGNHDAMRETFADHAPYTVDLPGVTLAVLDTVVPGIDSGQVATDQLEWLDQVGADAQGSVLVFGHHHPWAPGSNSRPERYFGINPDDSERLVEVVARRPAICGYFAGHTHRNRVRRFPSTGDVPWVEVACVKDFPGAWAEYRVFEGGILQVFRRISTPEALSWSERTRGLYGGAYEQYAFGGLGDRCFPIWPRR